LGIDIGARSDQSLRDEKLIGLVPRDDVQGRVAFKVFLVDCGASFQEDIDFRKACADYGTL